MRRTADEQLSPKQNHILWACQRGTWKIQVIPMTGLKRQGSGQLRNSQRCKTWKIGRKKLLEEKNTSDIEDWERVRESTENQLQDEFLLASAGNHTFTWPLHISPFYLPVMFVLAIWSFSIVAPFFLVTLHHSIGQNVSNWNWKLKIHSFCTLFSNRVTHKCPVLWLPVTDTINKSRVNSPVQQVMRVNSVYCNAK